MLSRIQTRLDSQATPLLVLVFVNLLLIISVCTLLSKHIIPTHGINIRTVATHFVMGSMDRNHSHTITVGAGDQERFYIQGKEITKGWVGIEELLKSWQCETPSRVTVIIFQDEAVSVGTMQRLVNRILLQGYSCTVAARPIIE